MSTTITFVERAVTGAVTSGGEVLLENLEHASWAWMFVVPGVLGVIATAVFGSLIAAGFGVAFVLLLAQLRTPEVTATLRVRCGSLAALARCLDVSARARGVTVSGVFPTSDEARRDGDIYVRARQRADEMCARAGLRVTELVTWEEAAVLPAPVRTDVVARKRSSMGEGLEHLTLAPDPAAVRFVFRAEAIS